MSQYQLVFSDEFQVDGAPDPQKWAWDVGADKWGNQELEYYTAGANAQVEGGRLILTARRESMGGKDYTSARLVTYPMHGFQYGRFEIRAKLPRGKGSWPAIWLLPEDFRQGRPWPLCGEIDIMEHVGWHEGWIHSSLHTQRYNHTLGTQLTHAQPLEDVCGRFHDYGLEWTPEKLEFFYDGEPVARFTKGAEGRDTSEQGWPFDKPYYLILNLAVGGTWGGEVDEQALPYRFEIEHVRIYQRI